MAFEDRKNRTKLPFNQGSPAIFTLQPGGKILQGYVIVAGTVRITGGTTSGTAVGQGGPLNLIKRIIVTANRLASSRYPGGKIVDCAPHSLVRYAITQRKGKYYIEQSGSTLGSGAAGTYAIYMSIPIYFATKNNWQTALNADLGNYSAIQVQVDTAASIADMFPGSDRTLDCSGLTIQWKDKRLGLSGDTTPLFQEDHVMLIPTTFDRAQDEGLPNDGAFESMLVLSEQGTSRTLSDGLLNKLTFSGQSLALEEWAADVRESMFAEGFWDPSTNATGQHFLDFTDGSLANSNPAAGLLVQWDVNNVSGANLDQFRIYTRRVFALAPASN
jgi:hypothetical protein